MSKKIVLATAIHATLYEPCTEAACVCVCVCVCVCAAEASARELEERRRAEGELRQSLARKEAEQLDMDERYASLQEEVAGKTRKLKDVWKQLQQAKEEVGHELTYMYNVCT